MAPPNEALPLALVPLPDHKFYLWQMLVHWTWMRDEGYPTQYLVYCGRSGPSPELASLMAGMGAHVAVWNDWRLNPQYNAAMKPGLVGRWLEAHPEDVDRPLLLLDPDALPLRPFVRAIERGELEPTADRWFGTDTDSYTGPGYLKSKGEDLWLSLCALVGVDPDLAALRPGRGSQWLFTGWPGGLWLEIAELSERAYPLLTGHRSDVQVWCAEMYVTQLVLARERIEAESRARMRMVWAGGARADWSKAGFFHNAGVTDPAAGHFHKGSFSERAPFFETLDGVSEGSASARYVEIIRAAEADFPDLCRLFT